MDHDAFDIFESGMGDFYDDQGEILDDSEDEDQQGDSSVQKKIKLGTDSNNDSEVTQRKKRIAEKRLKRKRQVAERARGSGEASGLSAAQLKQLKREEQMQKNRISAQRSRDKAKQERSEMQQRIDELESQNTDLRSQLSQQVCWSCRQSTARREEQLPPQFPGFGCSDDSLNSGSENKISFESFVYSNDEQQESSSFDLNNSYERVRLFSPARKTRNLSLFMLVLYLLAISIDSTGSVQNQLRTSSQLARYGPHQSFVQQYNDYISTHDPLKPPAGEPSRNVCLQEEQEILRCLNNEVGLPKKTPQDMLREYELNYLNDSASQSAVAVPNQLKQTAPGRNSFVLQETAEDAHLTGSKIYCPYSLKFDYDDSLDLVEGKPLKQFKILVDQQGLRQYRLAEDGSFEHSSIVESQPQNSSKMYELNCLVTEIKEIPTNNCGILNTHNI